MNKILESIISSTVGVSGVLPKVAKTSKDIYSIYLIDYRTNHIYIIDSINKICHLAIYFSNCDDSKLRRIFTVKLS